MPNWTTNLLTITGAADKIAACLEAIKGDKPDRDGQTPIICFQKILPMPAVLRNTGSGSRQFEDDPTKTIHDVWFEDSSLEDWKARSESARPLTDDEKAEIEKAGAKSWYDWAISNWGCKWNATETNLEGSAESGEVYIRFETPWSPPTPILHALREQHPDLEFSMRYRLEDDPEYPHDADEF